MKENKKIEYWRNTVIDTLPGEVWKSINWGDGYFVSNYGRVKSIDRYVNHWRGGTRLIIGKILCQCLRKGYLGVNLADNGEIKCESVHQLVARAFKKNKHGHSQINHEDCVKTNNLPENLRWCNTQYNVRHAYKHGLMMPIVGETHHNSKLSDKQHEEIIKLSKNGATPTNLAKMFGVCKVTIWKIKTYRSGKNRMANIS